MSPMPAPSRLVQRFASRLRFPVLFLITASLFLADLLVPDAIPLIDEILLGLITVLLGSWKGRKEEREPGGNVESPGRGT